jgi:chorismate dehydratase
MERQSLPPVHAVAGSKEGTKIRVGAVRYLNAKPLVYQLESLAPHAEIVYDLPSRLADGLAAGRLDVALIPSIESFQDPGYVIVSDACIACHGPALSVKLFSRVPVEEIRTLALDEGSRTSAALARILLKEQVGLKPELEKLPIGAAVYDTRADAVLLIGDRAMQPVREPFTVVWDLGEEWFRWTGVPVVFAMWIARGGVDLGGFDGALSAARDLGLANLDRIAADEAGPLGLEPSLCISYLRDHLHYRLGPREFLGLEIFRRLASRMGLAPAGAELGFYSRQSA